MASEEEVFKAWNEFICALADSAKLHRQDYPDFDYEPIATVLRFLHSDTPPQIAARNSDLAIAALDAAD
jgi:hypothetical protein